VALDDPSAGDGAAEEKVQGSDMEIVFLGTGSCMPTTARGVACSVLRMDGSFFMFDAGEGSQVQLQRSAVRPGNIDKIFVTHLHGDHAYGLPGVLCLIGNARGPHDPPVEIYGPAGLRLFVRTALALSRSRALPKYCVHELHEVPFLHSRFAREPQPLRVSCDPHLPFELEGDDIFPEKVPMDDGSEALQWRLFEDDNVAVRAAPLQHTVPCVGYVVREADRPGKLRVDTVLPLLEAQRAGLREIGVRDPRALLKRIKELQPGDVYDLPDGSVIRCEDALDPPQKGRKVVMLGDTCDAGPLAHLAHNADVVVHEATNTYMREYDGNDERDFGRQTYAHGHSTPAVAGKFATFVGARSLVLTHFSQRHHPASKRGVGRIEDAARTTVRPDCRVVAAHDLSRVFVSRRKDGPAIQFVPAPDELDANTVAAAQDALEDAGRTDLLNAQGRPRPNGRPPATGNGRPRGGGRGRDPR